LTWVRKTKSAQTLGRLAREGDALTHEVFDAEPAGKHLDYLRQLLIFAGCPHGTKQSKAPRSG